MAVILQIGTTSVHHPPKDVYIRGPNPAGPRPHRLPIHRPGISVRGITVTPGHHQEKTICSGLTVLEMPDHKRKLCRADEAALTSKILCTNP